MTAAAGRCGAFPRLWTPGSIREPCPSPSGIPLAGTTLQNSKGSKKFPADYICEAVDQTRGWFYSLHALSTLIEGEPSYRNVICLGLILDEKGQKMSKRVGNVVDPLAVLDEHGADALRWYLFTASHPGEARRFSSRLVNETLRRVLLTLWNVYSFFTNYASIDQFPPGPEACGLEAGKRVGPLDLIRVERPG